MRPTTKTLMLAFAMTSIMFTSGLPLRGKIDIHNLLASTESQQKDEQQINIESGIADMLYEGDIVLTDRQKEVLEGGGHGTTGKEQVFTRRHRRWSGGVVPYMISPSLASSSRALNAIHSGMREITTQSGGCVTFKRREQERNYVMFINGRGCRAHLGQVGGRQMISISTWGCATKGIVIHEIFHALGRTHEQNRPDRNEHVIINFNNIRRESRHNFRKERIADDHGLPYDFQSIMHYGPFDFAINRRIPVITSKRRGVTIGQREGLSRTDIEHLKKAYCRAGNTNSGRNRVWRLFG